MVGRALLDAMSLKPVSTENLRTIGTLPSWPLWMDQSVSLVSPTSPALSDFGIAPQPDPATLLFEGCCFE